jgi:hypothetical protein
MNIEVAAGSSLPNPPAGEVTLFINTEDNNILSYKDSSGNVKRYSTNDPELADCCACDIAKKAVAAAACALENGFMTSTEYNAFITTGVNVSVSQTDDGAGNKTYTINFGPKV